MLWSKVNQFVSLLLGYMGLNCGFLIRCGFVIRVWWSADQIFVLVWDSCSNSCPRRCCIKRRRREREGKREEVEKAAEKCGSFDPRPCWWSRRQWQCGVKDVNVKKTSGLAELRSTPSMPNDPINFAPQLRWPILHSTYLSPMANNRLEVAK